MQLIIAIPHQEDTAARNMEVFSELFFQDSENDRQFQRSADGGCNLVERRQFVFYGGEVFGGPLSLCDVHAKPRHADRLTTLIADDTDRLAQPHLPAIGGENAILERAISAFRQ